jgi:hypothetical protein
MALAHCGKVRDRPQQVSRRKGLVMTFDLDLEVRLAEGREGPAYSTEFGCAPTATCFCTWTCADTFDDPGCASQTHLATNCVEGPPTG